MYPKILFPLKYVHAVTDLKMINSMNYHYAQEYEVPVDLTEANYYFDFESITLIVFELLIKFGFCQIQTRELMTVYI